MCARYYAPTPVSNSADHDATPRPITMFRRTPCVHCSFFSAERFKFKVCSAELALISEYDLQWQDYCMLCIRV